MVVGLQARIVFLTWCIMDGDHTERIITVAKLMSKLVGNLLWALRLLLVEQEEDRGELTRILYDHHHQYLLRLAADP